MYGFESQGAAVPFIIGILSHEYLNVSFLTFKIKLPEASGDL